VNHALKEGERRGSAKKCERREDEDERKKKEIEK
jgi:hypothetical protein